MAGDWIKMTTSLHEHPAVLTISDELDIDELHVIGMLYRIWAWADTQTIDGEGINTTARRLDKLVNYPGFCDALRKAGWLEGRDNALTFPRFAEHNGETAKTRALGKNRTQRHRCNAKGVTGGAHPCNDDSVTPVTEKPLPEKRREEKNSSPTPSAGAGTRQKVSKASNVGEVIEVMKNATAVPQGEELSLCAEKFFDLNERDGWVNKQGHHYANWIPAAKIFASHWARNNATSPIGRPPGRRTDRNQGTANDGKSGRYTLP